jgi:hypothetical protein
MGARQHRLRKWLQLATPIRMSVNLYRVGCEFRSFLPSLNFFLDLPRPPCQPCANFPTSPELPGAGSTLGDLSQSSCLPQPLDFFFDLSRPSLDYVQPFSVPFNLLRRLSRVLFARFARSRWSARTVLWKVMVIHHSQVKNSLWLEIFVVEKKIIVVLPFKHSPSSFHNRTTICPLF